MSLFDVIQACIPNGREVPSTWLHQHGGIVLTKKEGELLTDYLNRLDGLHIDIGTYFGGSAILAALAKGHGKVISIDNQATGHWTSGLVTPQKVLENLQYFHVENRVQLVKANTHPWPLQLLELPTSAFIDGDEDDQAPNGGVLHDWENLAEIVTDLIIFHDCQPAYPGVLRTVEKACQHHDWKLIDAVDSTRVFLRIH